MKQRVIRAHLLVSEEERAAWEERMGAPVQELSTKALEELNWLLDRGSADDVRVAELIHNFGDGPQAAA